MNKIKRICFPICLFLSWSCSGYTQSITSNKSSYIISISTAYSSNIISPNSNGYDDLFLITFNKVIKIDSVISALSKKNSYTNESNILTTTESQFRVFSIVKDTPGKKVRLITLVRK